MQIANHPSLFHARVLCYNLAMNMVDGQPTGDSVLAGGLTPEASLVRLEEEVRRFWHRHDLPAAARAARRAGPPFMVYAQPLAVGQSRADQVRLLATADLFARYQAMQGAAVRQRIGWAGHGLSVEVDVERSLGPQVSAMEESAFNHACSERALAFADEGERLAAGLGLWLDPDQVYVTLSPDAVGIAWGALHRLWQMGRLRQERRVVPFCPRCATPLSAAEAVRDAVQAESLAAWLLLPWEQDPGTYLLVWTPAPWMLVGMVALAAHPEADYVLLELPGQAGAAPRRLLLAEAALRRRLAGLPTGGYQVLRRLPGKALRGATHRPPFTFVPAGEQSVDIVLSDEVPLDQGTGLMPVTPGFEARSLALAVARDMPLPRLLDDWGRFDETVAPWLGLSPLDAAPLVVDNLRSRGLLFRLERAQAPRPLCPYCQTPLLPLARKVWLAETGSGPWVLSRDRAWGVPLPVWICDDCGEATCLAGLDDLAHRAGVEAGRIDPHRPGVDRFTLPCPACGGVMRRAPEVVDADFELAALPLTAASLPEGPGAPSLAVGLGDRHLGWLGDTAEVAALLHGSLAWEQAVALGEEGEWPTGEPDRSRPADALRWAAYARLTPQQAEERFLQPLWALAAADAPAVEGGLLDRWLRARLHQLVQDVGRALDAADPFAAADHLAALVDDAAFWYLARQPAADAVGDEKLILLSKLLAPFVPHLAEAIRRRQAAARPRGPESSVHLAAWPAPPPDWQDEVLLGRMTLLRRLAALGHTARIAAGLAPDRPLRQGVVGLEGEAAAGWPGPGELQDLLARVLAVDAVKVRPYAAVQISWHLSLAPRREPVREVAPAAIADALAALEPGQAATLAGQLREGLSVSLQAGGRSITLLPDEVQAAPRAQPGWTAAAEGGLLVSLKLL